MYSIRFQRNTIRNCHWENYIEQKGVNEFELIESHIRKDGGLIKEKRKTLDLKQFTDYCHKNKGYEVEVLGQLQYKGENSMTQEQIQHENEQIIGLTDDYDRMMFESGFSDTDFDDLDAADIYRDTHRDEIEWEKDFVAHQSRMRNT